MMKIFLAYLPLNAFVEHTFWHKEYGAENPFSASDSVEVLRRSSFALLQPAPAFHC